MKILDSENENALPNGEFEDYEEGVTEGTLLPARTMNSLGNELHNFLAKAGIVPSYSDNEQLYKAVIKFITDADDKIVLQLMNLINEKGGKNAVDILFDDTVGLGAGNVQTAIENLKNLLESEVPDVDTIKGQVVNNTNNISLNTEKINSNTEAITIINKNIADYNDVKSQVEKNKNSIEVINNTIGNYEELQSIVNSNTEAIESNKQSIVDINNTISSYPEVVKQVETNKSNIEINSNNILEIEKKIADYDEVKNKANRSDALSQANKVDIGNLTDRVDLIESNVGGIEQTVASLLKEKKVFIYNEEQEYNVGDFVFKQVDALLNGRRPLIPPTYHQYADDEGAFNEDKEPQNYYRELYGIDTTWKKRYADKGYFLRTEGGKAMQDRVNGVQSDCIPALNGELNGILGVQNANGEGIVKVGAGTQSHRVATSGSGEWIYEHPLSIGTKNLVDYSVGDEVRPINALYRIWELVSFNGYVDSENLSVCKIYRVKASCIGRDPESALNKDYYQCIAILDNLSF